MAAERALIRPEDVAVMLSVSKRTVYRLVASGELPAIRLDRCVLVPVAGVHEWIERGLAGPGRR